MPSPSRRRARHSGAIDGLKVRIIDDPAAGDVDVDLDRALRTLARMMVRNHEAHGDQEAIASESRSASELTPPRDLAPHHDTNEAA